MTSERALKFLNQPKISKASSGTYEHTAAELYKYMRSGVVLIVGQ